MYNEIKIIPVVYAIWPYGFSVEHRFKGRTRFLVSMVTEHA